MTTDRPLQNYKNGEEVNSVSPALKKKKKDTFEQDSGFVKEYENSEGSRWSAQEGQRPESHKVL